MVKERLKTEKKYDCTKRIEEDGGRKGKKMKKRGIGKRGREVEQ
jgi:hypothetical protein